MTIQKQRESESQDHEAEGLEVKDINIPDTDHSMAEIEFALDPKAALEKLQKKIEKMASRPREICVCGNPSCRIGPFVRME